jgi:hypothetical protein
LLFCNPKQMEKLIRPQRSEEFLMASLLNR